MVNCHWPPNMSLQFQTTHRRVIDLLGGCGLRLPWLRHQSWSSSLRNNSYQLLLFTVGFYQFTFSASSIIRVATFQDMCTLGIVTSVLATGGSITLFFLLSQEQLKRFIEGWNNLNNNILNSSLPKSEEFRDMFQKVAKGNESFTRRILFVVFWTPIIYCIPVPVIDAIQNSYRTNLPLPILYPYDDHHPGTYEVTFFLHMMGLVISVMKKFGNDCFFLALFKIHLVYLRYLSISIENLREQFNKNDDDFTRRKLVSWIKIHKEVVRSTDDLISLYTPIIIIYYVNLICIVVFGLFTQIENDRDSSVQRFGTAIFCTINIFQLYMQCSSAEELNVEAEKVALEIYNTPWNKMNKSNAGLVRMMLHVAIRPIKVTAFKAPTFLLNKETFISFVVNTIRLFMTFSKMNDLHKIR